MPENRHISSSSGDSGFIGTAAKTSTVNAKCQRSVTQ
jgi:hypothetical protein